MKRALVFLAAATVTSVFFINLCGSIFQCGCQSLWAGADRLCNIHAAHGHHCPWCAIGMTGQAFVYGSMIAAQALIAFGPWFGTLFVRLLAALAAFPLLGFLLALCIGWITGYWS